MILFFAIIGMIACCLGVSVVVMLTYGIIKMWDVSHVDDYAGKD